MLWTVLRATAALAALIPNLALAARYYVDPKPQQIDYAIHVKQPWTMVFTPEKVERLNLLNFILDSEPEAQEGIDFPKYDRRNQFGSWLYRQPMKNCYNTRAEILMRDSMEPVTFSDHNPCTVKSGRWHDPYSGQEFTRAREIQIDHLVPLKNAYVSGAWKWDRKKRCHYGNFMAYGSHLVAVSAKENLRKGDRTPADYMPPETENACAYLQQWLNVKAVWDLTLDENEASAIRALMVSHRCTVRFQTVSETALNRQRQQMEQTDQACEYDPFNEVEVH